MALEAAVDMFRTQTAFAKAISAHVEKPGGIKQGHVWHWLNKSFRVPSKYALPVQAITAEKGNPITVHDLRPDVFGVAKK